MLQGILAFEWLGLSGNAWFTIVVVLLLFAAMIFSKLRVDIIFLLGMCALYLSGVLDLKTAFGGFSSASVIIIAVLYAVIAGLNYTGVLNWVVKHMMGSPKTVSRAILRTMFPVALLSSFLTNTTVVALFIDVIKIWSKKLGISPSKLLIPLSYASGLGGACTLLGTSTNLIFCLVVGVISIVALQKLLPTRVSPLSNGGDEDLTLELHVPSRHRLVGMSLQEIYEQNPNGFEKNKNSILAIRRFDNEVEVATPETYIMGSDNIIVSGKAEQLQWICEHLNLKNDHLKGYLENAVNNRTCGKKTILASLIMLAMVLLSAFNVLPLLSSCMLAAIAMVVTRCCTSTQAANSINWNILIVFSGSICLGKALESTGVAQLIANNLLNICGSNPYVALVAICLVGTFITEFISNSATAAMFCPIAISAATTLGVNPLTFCIGLMISVNSSFATPIGSPTHMLVYAAGGYKFTDFTKIGLPMNFIILAANLFITPIVFPMYPV